MYPREMFTATGAVHSPTLYSPIWPYIDQAIRAICIKYGIDSQGEWQKVDSDRLRDLLAGSVFHHPKVDDVLHTNDASLSWNQEGGTASTGPFMEEVVEQQEEPSASSGPVSYTMEDVVKRLEEEPQLGKLQDMTWVYLVDSGGQPQFHELLSAFVRNALVGIFVHKLSERLDDHPHIQCST